jgi:extracellular factor (EF) 3-hydroxypalmitic acid methyl ester biosynthesis protein
LDSIPLDEYQEQFYKHLTAIVAQAAENPALRETLRSQAFERGAAQLSRGYLQNQVRTKPYGYAGDFEVIDWMYRELEDVDILSGLWDRFYHRQAAATAVRNRKDYLVSEFGEIVRKRGGAITMLDLACGPCRDVAESIEAAGALSHGSVIHCLDMEPKAIEHARKVTKPYDAVVEFQWECSNVFRFRSNKMYDFVWSAGLFDYLNDKLSIALITKMWSLTAEGGTMIVGNFHPSNPTRNYMEWCMDWILIHRTEDELRELGIQAGIPVDRITIDQEPLGVCIFLRAQR